MALVDFLARTRVRGGKRAGPRSGSDAEYARYPQMQLNAAQQPADSNPPNTHAKYRRPFHLRLVTSPPLVMPLASECLSLRPAATGDDDTSRHRKGWCCSLSPPFPGAVTDQATAPIPRMLRLRTPSYRPYAPVRLPQLLLMMIMIDLLCSVCSVASRVLICTAPT